jgi:hypothetical protein
MMEDMNTTVRTARHSHPVQPAETTTIEQLTLLPSTSTPARFRLSKDTRERGMRHVAEIRQMLAARTNGAAPNQFITRDQAA